MSTLTPHTLRLELQNDKGITIETERFFLFLVFSCFSERQQREIQCVTKSLCIVVDLSLIVSIKMNHKITCLSHLLLMIFCFCVITQEANILISIYRYFIFAIKKNRTKKQNNTEI